MPLYRTTKLPNVTEHVAIATNPHNKHNFCGLGTMICLQVVCFQYISSTENQKYKPNLQARKRTISQFGHSVHERGA